MTADDRVANAKQAGSINVVSWVKIFQIYSKTVRIPNGDTEVNKANVAEMWPRRVIEVALFFIRYSICFVILVTSKYPKRKSVLRHLTFH